MIKPTPQELVQELTAKNDKFSIWLADQIEELDAKVELRANNLSDLAKDRRDLGPANDFYSSARIRLNAMTKVALEYLYGDK
jgi:hypothetical protein